MRRALLLLAGLLALAGIATASSGGATQAQPRWVITDLGTLGGPSSSPQAMNESGQVVGTADTKRKQDEYDWVEHAFLWQGGKMIDLRLGNWATPEDVNDRGQIVGRDTAARPYGAFLWDRGTRLTLEGLDVASAINEQGQVAGSGPVRPGSTSEHALLWENGSVTDLGTLGGAEIWSVANNEQGWVVGHGETRKKDANGDPYWHGFVWTKGRMTDLGTLGGNESDATAINERGQVVGWAETKSGLAHAFLWENGKMRDLTRRTSKAFGINERGQVVGWFETKKELAHAFLWEKGKLCDLGTLDGAEGYAFAINDRGQVAGDSYTWKGAQGSDEPVKHAFVWQAGHTTDLGALPGGRESDLGLADVITNSGQILGQSSTKKGDIHAVLWTLKH